MKSKIFYSDLYQDCEERIQDYLNKQTAFLNESTVRSTRGTGDAIQAILEDGFAELLKESIKDYSRDFNRRAMADMAFTDHDELYYVVDVKTHRMDTAFNMPNLTSVERLARFYENDMHCFVMLMVAYLLDGFVVRVQKVHFIPIEFLDWNCLTIGALGWGQIQILNSNRIEINPGCSRKKWMLELCEALFEFYPREMAKIEHRMGYFEKVKDRWFQKTDLWV